MIIDDFKANLAFFKPFTVAFKVPENEMASLWKLLLLLLKWYCCMLTRLVTLDCLCSGIAFSNSSLGVCTDCEYFRHHKIAIKGKNCLYIKSDNSLN